MGIFIDARPSGPAYQYRLWDTQTGTYLTGELDLAGVTRAIQAMLLEGGAHEGSDMRQVRTAWIDAAHRTGSNDPSRKPAGAGKLDWRQNEPSKLVAGPFRSALRAQAVAEQATRAILNVRVNEWMEGLSDGAQKFLRDSLILHELLRGTGNATYRSKQGLHLAEIEEITREWSAAVDVEIIDHDASGVTAFVFRLL